MSYTAQFGIVDYLVFCFMLSLSFGIGIYHAFKSRDSDDFVSGGKSFGLIPIAISMCASFNSPYSILGIPSEIYNYGIQFVLIILGMLVCVVLTAEVWIPILYGLKLDSVYEYFNLRYGSPIPRRLMSGIFIINTLLYLAIVMYAPSIAMTALTPLPWWGSILLLGISSTTYTALGGLKAIVWTDVVQIFFMMSAMFAVLIKGLMLVGGFSEMWRISGEGGRLNLFNFSANVFERHTFWNLLFGSIILSGSPYMTSQYLIHRTLCLSTPEKGRWSIYVTFCGQIIFLSVIGLTGLTLYSFYQECDPVSAGLISSNDAILPFFVSQEFGDISGMSGLFLSCLFSGSLSTLDSACHGLATVTFEELSSVPKLSRLTRGRETSALRVLSVIYGLLAMMLAFLYTNLGSLIQMAGVIIGGCSGPIFAYLIMSLFVPFVNLKGSTFGLISGQIFNVWISVGSAISAQQYAPLNMDLSGCPEMYNLTQYPPQKNYTSPPAEWNEFSDIYAMSYNLFPIIGFTATVLLSIAGSLATGGWQEAQEVDVNLVWDKTGNLFKKIETKV